MSIEARRVTKSFGSARVLDDVSLEVGEGRLVALLGASGSGKTTLLRILAGLEIADAGEVWIDGRDVTRTPVRERRIGVVFQHYALFQHLSVFENIAFGLRARRRSERPDEHAIRARVTQLLERIQLADFAQRRPGMLSGGQRQRVALARALAIEPHVLLLDEPFGALDAQVRHEMRRWLRELHEELQLTTVFVTHDQEEALELADDVAVLHAGRIAQFGAPEALYARPQSEFVMGFLGRVERFDAQLDGGALAFGPWRIEPPVELEHLRGPARVYLRPHDWEIDRVEPEVHAARARVARMHAAGPQVRLELSVPAVRTLHIEISQRRREHLELEPGAELFLWPRTARAFVD